jgi:hypothetical protein
MRAENQSLAMPLALSASCAALLLTLLFSPSARATACANEAIRQEQGPAALSLPDCRAYELVTPGSTPFVASNNQVEGSRASLSGDGLAYYTPYPATKAERSSSRYLTTRGASGWSPKDVTPQDSPTSSPLLNCEQGLEFSPDLSKSVLSDGWNPAEQGEPGHCSESEEVLAPGAPSGYGNLYLQNGSGAPYSLINLTPEGVTPANALLEDYTSDFSRILFSEAARLTPEAPAGDNLYLWSEGALHLVPFLPNGEPVSGTLASGTSLPSGAGGREFGLARLTHAASPDAESVFFYANGNLYLRRNATQSPTASGECSVVEPTKACTVQIDRKQGGSGESGGGVFWYASEDGSRVFFTDENKLTGDSKAVSGKPDLYEYEVATGLLRDRSHTGTAENPNARGFSGAGENADYLYFVARSVLTGSGENSEGAKAQPFSSNLYLLHNGAVSFIATLDTEADRFIWQEDFAATNVGRLVTAFSPSGRYLTFDTALPLTGFDNAPADPEDCSKNACDEQFLFDAQSKQLTCISCDPGGAAPTGDTKLLGPTSFSGRSAGRLGYIPRQVFDDGRVLFTTWNALTPADVNGAPDVYQYFGGELSLISSGAAIGGTAFLDASPTGSDVFFTTAQSLVGPDTDNGISIYDARVGGGFPETPPPPPPCEAGSCRGAASPPGSVTTPGSLGFSGPQEGPANPRRAHCRRGFVERHGKCKKTHHKKRKHHRRNAK